MLARRRSRLHRVTPAAGFLLRCAVVFMAVDALLVVFACDARLLRMTPRARFSLLGAVRFVTADALVVVLARCPRLIPVAPAARLDLFCRVRRMAAHALLVAIDHRRGVLPMARATRRRSAGRLVSDLVAMTTKTVSVPGARSDALGILERPRTMTAEAQGDARVLQIEAVRLVAVSTCRATSPGALVQPLGESRRLVATRARDCDRCRWPGVGLVAAGAAVLGDAVPGVLWNDLGAVALDAGLAGRATDIVLVVARTTVSVLHDLPFRQGDHAIVALGLATDHLRADEPMRPMTRDTLVVPLGKRRAHGDASPRLTVAVGAAAGRGHRLFMVAVATCAPGDLDIGLCVTGHAFCVVARFALGRHQPGGLVRPVAIAAFVAGLLRVVRPDGGQGALRFLVTCEARGGGFVDRGKIMARPAFAGTAVGARRTVKFHGRARMTLLALPRLGAQVLATELLVACLASDRFLGVGVKSMLRRALDSCDRGRATIVRRRTHLAWRIVTIPAAAR